MCATMVAMQTNQYPPPPVTTQSDPTSVMGRRIAAYLIDGVIALVVYVIAFVSILESLTMRSSEEATTLCEVVNNSPQSSVCINFGSTVYAGTGGDLGVIALIVMAFTVVFHVALPSLTGFSPGKGIMGLRVVKQDTMQTAGLGANLVRWLLWIVDAFPFPLMPLVGLITGLASGKHQRVGDMAASTLVVHKDSVGQVRESAPPATAWNPPSPTMPTAPPTPTAPVSDPFAAPTPSAPPTSFSPPASTTGAPPPPPGIWAPPSPSTDAPGGSDEPDPSSLEIAEPTASAKEPFEAAGATPEAPPENQPEPSPDPRPGVDAPQWDDARNTYIQWDPDIEQWMEWNEGQGR